MARASFRSVITWKSQTDVLTSLSLGQYIKASVWDFPVMTSLSVNKWYVTSVLKLINNSSIQNKGNHNHEGGLDTRS